MGHYPFFPMFVDLSEKRVLVVGAGRIAARRIMTLLRFCGHVEVVAPRVMPDVEAEPRVTVLRRAFEPGDLEGHDLVIAATDDHALNAEIAALCRGRGIPVNVSTDKSLCDFYFPGVVLDGDVAVGITASGQDHRQAGEVTRRIRECLSQNEV